MAKGEKYKRGEKKVIPIFCERKKDQLKPGWRRNVETSIPRFIQQGGKKRISGQPLLKRGG